jgi:hypothetical protein
LTGGYEKVAYQRQEYAVFNNVDEGVIRQKAVCDVRGSNLWMAAVIVAATAGFILFHGIFHNFVVRPNHHTNAPFYFIGLTLSWNYFVVDLVLVLDDFSLSVDERR